MQSRYFLSHSRLIVIGGAALLAGACAGKPLRTEKSTSEIRAAQAVGASEVPQAALHLKLAKESLARAEAYSANDEPEKAKSMLMRAEVDAELAVALSREDVERKQAEEAVAKVRKLRTGDPAGTSIHTGPGAGN